MSYNKEVLPHFVQTAGKITILTAFTGVLVFLIAFLFDAGIKQISSVSAATSTASTTLTVLNTPPAFSLNAYEVTESSTSTPTNSGDAISWRAIGTDSNGAPYFLIVCATSTAPTANPATSTLNLGTKAPQCAGGAQWGVSAATPSGQPATISTTTLETGYFATGAYSGEKHRWFAWVCDDDPFNPRCNATSTTGYSATNSSPYHINKRPVLSQFGNNGPVNPGAVLTFLSTSTDPDTVGGEDNIYLVVCQTNSYNTTTNTCSSNFLASTSPGVTVNASAAYTLASIVRDTSYGAYGFIVDQHGHEALGNPINQNFTVSNVAPNILSGDIILNGGSNITLTNEGGETTGFTLQVTVTDANSCTTTVGVAEISSIDTTVFRTSKNTTSCSWNALHYNPNDCYTSSVPTTAWNITCTASSTSCTGPTDDSRVFSCTFPLWFVADPTDNAVNIPVAYSSTAWTAGVRAIDDDSVFSNTATTSSPVELISFTALDLLTAEIPYGAIEPGQISGTPAGTLTATTTIENVGNTGIDQEITGESMCTTFSTNNKCKASATSTVAEVNQKFASTSITYASGLSQTLSSTTIKEVELDVNKTISTSTPNSGVTYWGIAVPGSITLAGVYSGLNYFTAKTAEQGDW